MFPDNDDYLNTDNQLFEPIEDLDLYQQNNERENDEDFIRSQEENGW